MGESKNIKLWKEANRLASKHCYKKFTYSVSSTETIRHNLKRRYEVGVMFFLEKRVVGKVGAGAETISSTIKQLKMKLKEHKIKSKKYFAL